jgi:3-oxoacyl-[acyl-carrier protein] reductase
MNNIVIFGGTSGLAKKVIPNLNGSVTALSSKQCDVRNYSDIEMQLKGHNVAIFFSVINKDNLISNINTDELNQQIDVNIKGYVNLLTAAGNVWKKTGGSIIYISSILSSTPIKGTSIYSSCKSFGDTMTKVFALEGAKYKIRCNSIQLGYFDGGLTYQVPEKVLESVKNTIPVKRLGECSELADLINMISNNDYLTGSIIKLAGGLQ